MSNHYSTSTPAAPVRRFPKSPLLFLSSIYFLSGVIQAIQYFS